MKFNLAITVTSAVILMIFDSTVTAQQQTLTVQQPVVSQFNVRNSVSVPDGGSIGLGGISRSSTGVLSRGVPGFARPFGNRGIGRSTSRSHASVSAWVLSNKEINEAILSGATTAKKSTVPYYKQAWSHQQKPVTRTSLPQPIPPAPISPVKEPAGIFLGLP